MGARSDKKTALPFRLHAAVTCPPAAELATALAWELGDPDPERLERALAVPVKVDGDPAAQLRALAAARPLCARTDGGPEALLIDRVVERGHGHPLLVAIVLAETGRRAGLPVGLVGGARGHFVAHQRLCQPLVLDPCRGELVDAGTL